MRIQSFSDLTEQVRNIKPVTLAIGQAADQTILEAVKLSIEKELQIKFKLVGNGQEIKNLSQNIGLDLDTDYLEIIEESDEKSAATTAVKLVSSGEADYLMKGLIGTSSFLKEVLNSDYGLRTGRILSHLACIDVANLDRLLFITDGGINISPELEEKQVIIQNAADFVNSIGVSPPKVAALAAVEQVNPKMKATVDGAILSKMADRGQIKNAVVDGPFALDNAVSKEAAEHKGISSPVAGEADILFVSDIEEGNQLAKSLTFLGGATMAGLVVGAKTPIVLTSRSDNLETKMTSMALGALSINN
ncbi:bifunctional enoyl-CoA hydratase/phosphate acetyltransferase [Natranaerobius thermophilus]|uniref:Phosphate butyryltransferase n=1 Tax=Natranaerobius thermophilus (strain ATCC BAA-1301 / DSM 18059 / JW/NM-WN-LF) TaxID=457570 RepID=B2A2E7_NATTJ|nr:bifunctional enoyl-CoA hydratase/phosphate acetyltransferase [Natranaerobius thermophilus]ACB86253.1 Phosphate butyryltransferase [Natranaerobius thermophilus JW/NM-WN-LF]